MFSEKTIVLKPTFLKTVFSLLVLYGILVFYKSCVYQENPPIYKRQFAASAAKIISQQLCNNTAVKEVCNGKAVYQEADGAIAYVSIYGVTNRYEMDLISKIVVNLWIERDTRIPVRIMFYADLADSHKLFKHKPIKVLALKGV